MLGESTQFNTAEPSFFYLLMATTYFQQAARTHQPNARDTLHDIGSEYLAKARRTVPAHKRAGAYGLAY